MDVSAAGAFAAYTYRTALASAGPAQAMLQAFQAATAAGAQTAALDGGGADSALLSLYTQAPSAFATYQLAAQAGSGAAAVQALLAGMPAADPLLSAGTHTFPIANPDLAAALTSYTLAQALQSGMSPARFGQQLAAGASFQALGGVNLLI